MITLSVKNGITLPKTYLSTNTYKQIKKDLIIINPLYLTCLEYGKRPVKKTPDGKYVPIPKTLNFMKEYKDRLELPNGYYKRLAEILEEDIELKYLPCIDVRNLLSKELVNVDLFDYQVKASEELLTENCGILSSPAASGKTMIGIDVVAKLGIKTLWLVHLNRLAKQSLDVFLKNTDCSEEDTGIISAGKYNVGKAFTSAVINTARTYRTQLSKENFGLVIIDECHHSPVKRMYDVLIKLSPTYLYGLSATPYRADGVDDIMKYMIGTNITEVKREVLVANKRIITPKVNVVYTNKAITTKLGSTYVEFMQSLITDKDRNVIILYEILKEAMDENICLVLSDRVEHCKILNDMLLQIYPFTSIVSGRTKKKEADKIMLKLDSQQINILITTYQFLSEGIDIPQLNRLFFTTPFKSKIRCEQGIGRIQRVHNTNKDAILYDFVDSNRLTKTQLNSRLQIYNKLGCKVSFKKPST